MLAQVGLDDQDGSCVRRLARGRLARVHPVDSTAHGHHSSVPCVSAVRQCSARGVRHDRISRPEEKPPCSWRKHDRTSPNFCIRGCCCRRGVRSERRCHIAVGSYTRALRILGRSSAKSGASGRRIEVVSHSCSQPLPCSRKVKRGLSSANFRNPALE